MRVAAMTSRRVGREATRLRGQSITEYVLIAAVIGLVVIFAGPQVSGAIRNQLGQVAETVDDGSVGENFYDATELPDPENGTAFAVYSEDDCSLMFYKRRGTPQVGEIFNDRRATEVYTGFEAMRYAVETTEDKTANDWTCKTLPWWKHREEIKTVKVIDTGIAPKSIDGWFLRMPNLTTADLEKLDCSATSARCAFLRCPSLASLKTPSQFRPTRIDDFVYGCTVLNDIDTSNWDMSACETIAWAFSGCEKLETITGIETWNTSSVRQMPGAFAGCLNLASLDVSHFDTSRVVDMELMFSGCSSLTTLDLGSFSTNSVMDMSGMFSNCASLSVIDLKAFDMQNVKDMSMMFNGCIALRTIALRNPNVANATDMNCMFYGCSNLALDCSNWNARPDAYRDRFNFAAPSVTMPRAWQ